MGATGVDLPTATSALCVQAVALATQATGATTVVGTLTESAAGSRQFTYAATPTDRLRITWGDGTINEFTITTLQSMATTYDAFFDADFAIAYRFVKPGDTDLTVNGSRSNGTLSGSVQGSFTLEGVLYTVQGNRTGTVVAAVDSGYAESTSEETTTGTLTATGFSETLNEYRLGHVLVYNGVTTQNYQRHTSSSWTRGGVAFAFVNARVHRAYVNMRPGDAAYWLADGALLREGVQVGGVSMQNNGVTIDVVLTVDGQTQILEQYPAQ
ncbi:MAG: hypothetical protein HY904_09635 [Deltaproteobacteria bacterium]|nr:hypothetical protein [Deltaproteobacteria bacterium]